MSNGVLVLAGIFMFFVLFPLLDLLAWKLGSFLKRLLEAKA